jgi:hypothetical protein
MSQQDSAKAFLLLFAAPAIWNPYLQLWLAICMPLTTTPPKR